MLKSYLCDYSDIHILVKGTVVGTGTVVAVQADGNNKKQYSKFMYLLLAA